jgi:uncharacterized protein (TIGR00369 family)
MNLPHVPDPPERLPEDLLARLRARFSVFPLVEGWNLAIEELGPGTATLTAGPSARILNGPSGSINGGVLATLADMACALALSTRFDGVMSFATSDLHIRYLEPARVQVTATASVVRLSARSAVLECRLSCGDRPAALATAHFALNARRRS